MNLSNLIGALARYIRECGGSPTKTRVLKLLYLLDVEAFRKTGETLTGFDWVFHRFGPWAKTYDDALVAAEHVGRIRIAAPAFSDEGATFINSVGDVSLSDVFPNVVQELTSKRIIEAWADKPLAELLDYVYFHTAPMRDAERNAQLDFSTLKNEEKLQRFSEIKSGLSTKEIEIKRRLFREQKSLTMKREIKPLDPPPNYDDSYWSSIAMLESETD
jgi:hypothetical protein